jgi:hypothetical protein
MNDTSLTLNTRTPELPAPEPFERGSAELPTSLAPQAWAAEPIVLLVDVADDPVWAAETAVEIAEAWARAGRRVVLADLHLEDPVLHERVGEPNLDGVVDIFLYGASLARSARPPHGYEFFFVPAGTYTARPAEVYGHSRWEKLSAGFREAEATLLVFAPGSAPGVERLAEWAATGVFLGEPAADRWSRWAPSQVRAVLVPRLAEQGVVPVEEQAVEAVAPLPPPEPAEPDQLEEDASAAVTEPGIGEEPARVGDRAQDEPETESETGVVEEEHRGSAETLDPEPEPIAAWQAERRHRATAPPPDGDGFLAESKSAPQPWDHPDGETEASEAEGAEVGEREPFAAVSSTPGSEGFGRAEADLGGELHGERIEEPPLPTGIAGGRGRRRRRRSGPGPMIWLLVGVAVLAAAVLIAAILRPDLFGIMGVGPRLEPTEALGAVEAIPPAPATPVAAGDTLPFAVQVRAFASFPAAHSEVQRAARRVPEIPHYIVPEQVQGVLYYKVIAGVLPDTVAATDLRRRLVETGVVSARDARDDAPGAWSLIQYRPLTFHLGEFPDREQAVARADSARASDIDAYTVTVPYTDGSERWRVYAGAFPDSARAEDLRLMLQGAGLPARLVTRVGRAPAAAQ